MKPEAPDQKVDSSYCDDLATPWWADAPRCAGEDCSASINEDDGPLCAECKAEAEVGVV